MPLALGELKPEVGESGRDAAVDDVVTDLHLESHVLLALDMDMPAETFGRIHHLPAAQLGAVIEGLRERGIVGADGWLSDHGRTVKRRIESLTDELAWPPYAALTPDEFDELVAILEPLAPILVAAQPWS